MNAWLLAQHCSLLALLIVAAYTDLSRGKVYNWCTYPAIALGLALAHILDAYVDRPWHLKNSVWGIVIGVLIFALPYFLRWVSAGDVKLIAAVGAVAGGWIGGRPFILYATVYSAIMGAVLGLAVLIWNRQLWAGLKKSLWLCVTFRRGPRPAPPSDEAPPVRSVAEQTIPYGFAIATGTMLAWFVFLHAGLLDATRM